MPRQNVGGVQALISVQSRSPTLRKRYVIDVRNIGIMAGIELEPRPGCPSVRAFEAFVRCFERGLLIRTTGDIIALSPPLIIERRQIDQIVSTLGEVIQGVA